MHHRPVSSAATPANPAQFVRGDLSLDIVAIKAVAKARYALKLDFINDYTGAPRRFWQRNIARRIVGEVLKQATDQRHQLVWAQMPRELPFTKAELERRDELRGIITTAPITAIGNADYKRAAGEYGEIGKAAQRRAYDAILESYRSLTPAPERSGTYCGKPGARKAGTALSAGRA